MGILRKYSTQKSFPRRCALRATSLSSPTCDPVRKTNEWVSLQTHCIRVFLWVPGICVSALPGDSPAGAGWTHCPPGGFKGKVSCIILKKRIHKPFCSMFIHLEMVKSSY